MMLSLLLLAGLAAAELYPEQSPYNHTCALNQDPPLSCTDAANLTLTPSVDSCCAETFGPLVLLTQFWTIYTNLESEGQLLPKEHWGIHGLWPDFCDGSYTQWCDLSKQFDPDPDPSTPYGAAENTTAEPWTGENFDDIIASFGALDLIAYLNKHWIARNQPNWVLWAHEYSKHATCFSTFQDQCYGPKYVPREDTVDYLTTTVERHKELPTYDWLAEDGHTPSNSTGYSLSDFEQTLTKRYGALPHIGCSGDRYNETEAGAGSSDNGRVYLSEVWYYSHVYGRPQDGHYLPADTTYPSTCTSTEGALQYAERAEGSERVV